MVSVHSLLSAIIQNRWKGPRNFPWPAQNGEPWMLPRWSGTTFSTPHLSVCDCETEKERQTYRQSKSAPHATVALVSTLSFSPNMRRHTHSTSCASPPPFSSHFAWHHYLTADPSSYTLHALHLWFKRLNLDGMGSGKKKSRAKQKQCHFPSFPLKKVEVS